MEAGRGVPFLSLEVDSDAAGAQRVRERLDAFAVESGVERDVRARCRAAIADILEAIIHAEQGAGGGLLQVEVDFDKGDLQVVLTQHGLGADAGSRLRRHLATMQARSDDFAARRVEPAGIEVWTSFRQDAED